MCGILLIFLGIILFFGNSFEEYESCGRHAGALHFLRMVIEYFRGSSQLEEASFRCAVILKQLTTFEGCARSEAKRMSARRARAGNKRNAQKKKKSGHEKTVNKCTLTL